MNRFNALTAYFRLRFGARVQKIPLDAGASCPNRDGVLSRGGCIFCNPQGSGSGLGQVGMPLAAQWAHWQDRYGLSRNARTFIAYLQSFSNTYGPASRLRSILEQLQVLPGIAGVAVGTRPDCVDEEKLDMLAAVPLPELWLELGVQSGDDATLARINRGHTARCSEDAIRMAAERGLRVCAHVMAGLPGEDAQAFLSTVAWLNGLPIHAIKFHALYVCHGTPLAAQFARGAYQPMTEDAYIDMMLQALPRLRSHIVVQRLAGDPAADELVAPAWAVSGQQVSRRITDALEEHALWQGCENDARAGLPLWYTPLASLPWKYKAAWLAQCEALQTENPFFAAASWPAAAVE